MVIKSAPGDIDEAWPRGFISNVEARELLLPVTELFSQN